jgi:putative transposase
MRFGFIEQHARTFPVRLMCRVLGVSASGYYAWRSRPESHRASAYRRLLQEVHQLHAQHQGRYGSPRMHAALRAQGHRVSRGRVERLMRRHGIRALARRRFRPTTTDSRHTLPIAPNLLQQEFAVSVPNQVWLADITYIPTGEGWLYLAAVLDLATRKVVGWAMRDHMRTELTLGALIMAAQRQRPGPGLIHHSDRGSQDRFKLSSQHVFCCPPAATRQAPRQGFSSPASFLVLH